MKHILLLSLCWAIFPTIHVIWEGGVLGSPYTDLYPSLWSLWAYPNSDWTYTTLLNYPLGMGWYPPSILHVALAYPLHFFFTTSTIYNYTLILFRFLCPLLSYFAARSWNFSKEGSTVISVLFACSPFCQGFAVEGIIEGLTAWTIPLWLYFCGRKHRFGMIFSFALCCISNWYFGACICVMACFLSVQYRFVGWSFFGLFLVMPFLLMFLDAWQDIPTIDEAIRQSMGISWQGFLPSIEGNTVLAKNNYLSWIAIVMIIQFRSRYTLLLIGSILLSNNILGSLPLFEQIRFPYRFHVITLICAGCLIAPNTNKPWFAYAIFIEQILLGGMIFQIPTQSIQPEGNYSSVDKPILHIPGTYGMPAGKPNPSRMRFGEILLAQMQHQQPLMNRGDFNSLEGQWDDPNIWLRQDVLYRKERAKILDKDIEKLSKDGIGYIAVHPEWLNPQTIQDLKSCSDLLLVSEQRSNNLLLFKIPLVDAPK